MDFKDKNGEKGGEEGHSDHEKMGMRGNTLKVITMYYKQPLIQKAL